MLFGVNPLAGTVLSALNFSQDQIPRLRDAYFDAEENQLVIYTRTGGGNREVYEEFNDENEDGPWNSTMQEHPNFIRDEDDDFDCTYAYFYFSIPESFAPLFKTFKDLGAGKDANPTERFAKMIEDLSNGGDSPDAKRALEVGKTIVEQLNKAIKDA